uniref:Leucine rich repeat protein n=1 Tax=Panagrolaimus sp. ES5 TaxID=591445 RepID=A0AC34F6D9_9BILA
MLKVLYLSRNKLTLVNCNKLPSTLEELYLADNQLAEIHFIERLKKLKVLKLTNNKIRVLPIGILQLHQLCFLFLSTNRLTAFPKNFENLKNLIFLDMRCNNFHCKTQNLAHLLWERLPKNLSTLKISGNYLGELPCRLSKLPLDYLEAIDCNLRHICPQLRKYQNSENLKVYEANLLAKNDIKIMDLRENPDLEHLNFVPENIYDPPSSTEKFVHDKSFEKANFAFITDHKFQNLEKFPHREKKPVYNFAKKPLTIQENELTCHCCSRCGIHCNDENSIIETLMVMDFYLVNVGSRLTQLPEKSIRILELPIKPEEEIKTYKISSTWIRAKKNEKSIFDHEHTKLLPEKWKTLVRTIMCDNCIESIKKQIKDFDSNDKNVKDFSSMTNTPDPGSHNGSIHCNQNSASNTKIINKPKPSNVSSLSTIVPFSSFNPPKQGRVDNYYNIQLTTQSNITKKSSRIFNNNSVDSNININNCYPIKNTTNAYTQECDQEASTSWQQSITNASVPNYNYHLNADTEDTASLSSFSFTDSDSLVDNFDYICYDKTFETEVSMQKHGQEVSASWDQSKISYSCQPFNTIKKDTICVQQDQRIRYQQNVTQPQLEQPVYETTTQYG